MGSKNVDLRKKEKEMNDLAISLKKYLLVYYGIYSESNKFKMSHKDVAILSPYIKRVGFNYVLNHRGDLYKGKIVPVVDSYGNVAPYIAPVEINKYFDNSSYYNEDTKSAKSELVKKKVYKYKKNK